MSIVDIVFIYILINAVMTVYEQFIAIPRMFPEIKEKYWAWISRNIVKHVLVGLFLALPLYITAVICVKTRRQKGGFPTKEEHQKKLEKIFDRDEEEAP